METISDNWRESTFDLQSDLCDGLFLSVISVENWKTARLAKTFAPSRLRIANIEIRPVKHGRNRRGRFRVDLAEHLHRHFGARLFAGRQLTFAEIQSPRRGHVGSWFAGRKMAHDDPVVRADRRGAVRTPRTGLVEGAGAPHVLAGAMFLGVVNGHGMISSPTCRVFSFNQPHQLPFDGLTILRSILCKVLDVSPLILQTESCESLLDRVVLGIHHGSCGPLGKSRPTA